MDHINELEIAQVNKDEGFCSGKVEVYLNGKMRHLQKRDMHK